MEKPKIILGFADGIEASYLRYFEEYFEVTVLDLQNRLNDHIIPTVVLFTGGEDVSPEYYQEPIGKFTHFNKNRDHRESSVFQRFKGKSLLLGICRGAQFLTVMNMGKLVQHVEGHGVANTHPISTTLNGGMMDLKMTSTHHQMMFPFELEQNVDYILLAWSKHFRSTTYLNGNDEEIELPPHFLEPEIVYYPKTRSLCIQGHPEYSICPKETKDIVMHKLIFPRI